MSTLYEPGVCRYEEMDENKGSVRNETLSVKEE